MKIDLKEIEKSLVTFKDEVLTKAKEGVATTDELSAMEKSFDEKMATQLKEMGKRKASLAGLEGSEKKEFSFAKCVNAQINGKWAADAGYEKEVVEATAQIKSNNAQSGEAGGYLIPEEHTSELIDLAVANTPVFEMGPTVLRNLRGELPIPKTTGRPTAYWVGEEEEATESETTFGEIVLRPKTIAAFTKVSRRLMHQSSNTIEGVIRGELVKSFGLGINTALLTGSGTDKVPKGISNFSGLTATDAIGTNGGRFTIDKAAEMAMNIDVANMLNGNLGYIVRPEVLSYMLRERVAQFTGQPSGTGQPISASNVIMSHAELEATLGYKIRTTTLLGNTTVKGTGNSGSDVFFGDWSQLTVGMWEGFEIKASDVAGNASGSAMTQRQIWITAFQGLDSNIKDETGFTTISDAMTASADL
jgi:HK97 family phage major capsid protein